MTSEQTCRLKYIRQRPLYYNLQWNRDPILLSSRANLSGTAPLNSTSTAAKTATEVLGWHLTAGHEAEIFKTWLDLRGERACKCGHTPSEAAKELSSEGEARSEPPYFDEDKENKYITPPVENPISIPIPAPCHPCSSSMVCPALEEIVEEPREVACNKLDVLLREAEVERMRDLQEESSQSVVCLLPRLGSERWRRLDGIHQMHPGPGGREQRATQFRPYVRRAFSRYPAELWGPGEPGRQSATPPSSFLGAVDSSLLWGDSKLSVELEADYQSYRSPAITHKRAEHLALKPIDQINLQLVHHILYCAT